MGTDFTYEEVVYRKWGDETYTLMGEENFPGHQSILDGKTYYKDTPCYVIEAQPKKKTGTTPSGRSTWKKTPLSGSTTPTSIKWVAVKKHFLSTGRPLRGVNLPWNGYSKLRTSRSNHSTIIDLQKVQFDQGLSEKLFTERALMRTKW